MGGVIWNSMGWEGKSCLIVGMIQAWTGMMVAFFDKSVWKLDAETKHESTLTNTAGGDPGRMR